MLSKPSPFFAIFNKSYCGAMNAVVSCYFTLRSAVSKYAENLTFGKNRLPISFAFASKSSVSAFNNGVPLILGSGSKPKMFWIYTSWIVTSVANLLVFWRRSFVDLIKVATSNSGSCPFGNGAITISVGWPLPNPASSLRIYSIASERVYLYFHPVMLATCGSHLNRGER